MSRTRWSGLNDENGSWNAGRNDNPPRAELIGLREMGADLGPTGPCEAPEPPADPATVLGDVGISP